MKMNKYKDYIAGVLFGAVGVYLLVSKKIVKGINMFNVSAEIPLTKADTYLRMLGGLLLLLSVCLLVSTFIKQKKNPDRNGENTPINKMNLFYTVGFFAAIVIYALLIDVIGFFFDTLWFSFLFSFALRIKELGISFQDKKALSSAALNCLIYSLILDGALIAIFTFVLKVQLP